jgi:alpha-N-arabinofuranosidase
MALPRRAAPIELRIAARGARYDFSWSADGRRWTSLARDVDGTILSTKRAGGFVGAMFGLYAHDPDGADD